MSVNNTAIAEIFRHLSDKEWHTIFSIHERFRLNPLELFENIEYFKSLNLIEENDSQLRLKTIEDPKVLGDLVNIFRKRKLKIEDERLLDFNKQKLTINELYLPEKRLLDMKLTPAYKEKFKKGKHKDS